MSTITPAQPQALARCCVTRTISRNQTTRPSAAIIPVIKLMFNPDRCSVSAVIEDPSSVLRVQVVCPRVRFLQPLLRRITQQAFRLRTDEGKVKLGKSISQTIPSMECAKDSYCCRLFRSSSSIRFRSVMFSTEPSM